MGTILGDIKNAVGVDEHNLGFDKELLIWINTAASALTQIGLTEFETLIIEANTEWPTFDNETILASVRSYLVMRVRKMFDPIPSETIAKSFDSLITEFEGRIAHEQEEVNANA